MKTTFALRQGGVRATKELDGLVCAAKHQAVLVAKVGGVDVYIEVEKCTVDLVNGVALVELRNQSDKGMNAAPPNAPHPGELVGALEDAGWTVE